jgi:hypothetical protein
VWTREERGEKKLSTGTSFEDAIPTIARIFTTKSFLSPFARSILHTQIGFELTKILDMALVALHNEGVLKHVVTQNVDNLHLKSGLPRSAFSELHGNVFMEKCEKCSMEYIRSKELKTIGFKYTGNKCEV